MVVARCSQWAFVFCRGIASSAPLRVSASAATVREVGRLMPYAASTPYEPGQAFIHRTFAYKGIIVCAFNTRFHEKKEASSEKITMTKDYYQVLIHRGDWSHMMFPVDLTSYLGEGSTRGEKTLNIINGMDCVSHDDIIAFDSIEKTPVEHDLFQRMFARNETTGRTTLLPALVMNYTASQRSWMAPRDVYREMTEDVEVTVMTFYLGANNVGGQLRHMWRYVIRIENHAPQRSIILRERSLKIYSLNNMNQANAHGVVGKQPELSVATPAFQFSSTIELAHSKGGHMWGQFKMERDNGSTFNVVIPTVALEPQEDVISPAEKISE